MSSTTKTPKKINKSSNDSLVSAAEGSGDDLAIEDKADCDDITNAEETKLDEFSGTQDESSLGDESLQQEMPLLYYTRVKGNTLRPPLPNTGSNEREEPSTSLPFSHDCTCSVMGQIRWSPDMLAVEGGGTPELFFRTGRPDAAVSNTTLGGAHNSNVGASSTTTPEQSDHQTQQFHTLEEEAAAAAAAEAKLTMEQSMPVVAMGFENGTIQLLDGRCLDGTTVPLSTTLSVREGNPRAPPPIVAVNLDASGTCLAALDKAGMCTIFEYKLQYVRKSNRVQLPPDNSGAQPLNATGSPTAGNASMFSSFMSAFTGSTTAGTANRNNDNDASNESNTSMNGPNCMGTWRITAVQATRISYPSSFGRPTVLALDPAYKRRREKALLIGFADGRLILTKRGLLFQRRVDNVLYQQAGSKSGQSEDGIQALAWRGSLVAWADASGVRLLDSDQLTRIAHIDPPVGARQSLYAHQLVEMKPHLCFETKDRLLVAWGDCLLQLRIREATGQHSQQNFASSTNNQNNNSSGSAPPGSEGEATTGDANVPTVVRRRTVECNMAWQLDVVACGVAPLDADHVMVLGVVVSPPAGEVDDKSGSGQTTPGAVENDIELQIISRASGQVAYADLLPIVRRPEGDSKSLSKRTMRGKQSQKAVPESVGAFTLLSTFHFPRMDDNLEIQGQVVVPETSFDLFGGAAGGGAIPGASLVGGVTAALPQNRSKQYQDSHIRWNLNMVSFQLEDETKEDEPNTEEDTVDDSKSIDSDIYDFVTRPVKQQRMLGIDSANSSGGTFFYAQAPTMLVVTRSDAVAVRLRTIDDAVDHALEENKTAVALQKAITFSPGLRQYSISAVVNEYFQALLRLPTQEDAREEIYDSKYPKLSLRRMKLAASSMPVLLGGDSTLWKEWVGALGNISGSLFVVWSQIPVRDPILPKTVYSNALCNMIAHIDNLRNRDDSGVDIDRLVEEAENHFLHALLAWGSSLVLKEFVKLYKYQTDLSRRFSAILTSTEKSLQRRYNQSAATYLSFPVTTDGEGEQTGSDLSEIDYPDDVGTLFDVETFQRYLNDHTQRFPDSGKVALEAKARISMMKGDYDGALRHYLTLGALYGSRSMDEVESEAVKMVMDSNDTNTSGDQSHSFVIALIENRHLHQCLLDVNFTSDETSTMPIFALLRLVDLRLVGTFLMEHCAAPREATKNAYGANNRGSLVPERGQGRLGTMSLDIVAAQLESSPKLLFWYLHLLFSRKPEFYVNFPKTANLPTSITSLHRKNFDLHIKFAGDKRDSAKAIEGIESYRVTQTDTPLLKFLKVILQLGGLSPIEVGKRLQIERKGNAGISGAFALEMAYVMENFGDDSEEESRAILDLYLKGAKSLNHAVSFAQRTKQYSSQLWEILIEYCLTTSSQKSSRSSADGSLFGLLLESAALSGANLAHLVSQIPPGMSIEGLRPRLVAAVADSRWKLQMHQGAAEVATSEKIGLLREVAHRSRRGRRYHPSDRIEKPEWANQAMLGDDADSSHSEDQTTLPKQLRPRIRKERNFLSYSSIHGML